MDCVIFMEKNTTFTKPYSIGYEGNLYDNDEPEEILIERYKNGTNHVPY